MRPGDKRDSQEDVAAPNAGLGKRLWGYLMLLSLFASLGLMIIGNPHYGLMPDGTRLFGLDRTGVGAVGLLLFLGMLLLFYIRRKLRLQSPTEQRFEEAAERTRNNPVMMRALRRRRWALKYLLPTILLSLPILLVMNTMGGSIPLLDRASEADRERIGVVLGAIIVAAGYGLYFLFAYLRRRADVGTAGSNSSMSAALPPNTIAKEITFPPVPRTDPAVQHLWKRPGSTAGGP